MSTCTFQWLAAVSLTSKENSYVFTWSDPQASVHNSLYTLQKESAFCDVRLFDAKGYDVPAHACILAAGCPVLKSALLLEHSNRWLKEDGIKLRVGGITQKEWLIILEYLYTGRINIGLDSELIRNIHRAARMLKITGLATLIWKKVASLRLKVRCCIFSYLR